MAGVGALGAATGKGAAPLSAEFRRVWHRSRLCALRSCAREPGLPAPEWRTQGASRGAVRVGADNLLYSSGEEAEAAERVYEQLLGTLPGPLQEGLGQGMDLRVVLSDALASLPLISQRAMRALAHGYDVAAIADAEGVSVSTMNWLLSTAQEHLRDILEGRLGADDGARYRGS